MQQQRSRRLAQEFQHFLREHNLSINAAHLRYGISREALTKMGNGLPPTVDVVEKFAREAGLDVNEWRMLAGYEPVAERWNPRTALLEGIQELQKEFGEFQISTSVLSLEKANPEEVEVRLETIRRWLEEQRTKQAAS